MVVKNPPFSLFVSELIGSRHVLSQLIFQQLILRYRRTALGYLWTFINPLLIMSVMAIVFSTLFKADLRSFTVFLFAAKNSRMSLSFCYFWCV